jgi:trimethylamine--corrinoid protein Co-methyltransferase
MNLKAEIKVLSPAELKRIIHQGLEVLAEITFRVKGPAEFFERVSLYGCEVVAEGIKFPRRVIEKTLGKIEERKEKLLSKERDPFSKEELEFYASGQAIWCCDPQTDALRPATTSDLADISRVIDALPGVGRRHPTFIPQDVPLEVRDLAAFITILLSSSQAHRVSIYSSSNVKYFIEAGIVALGSEEKLREKVPFTGRVWLISPFTIGEENLEIAMGLRQKLGVPLDFWIMPVAGVAAPVTLAGCLTQEVAEVLAANIITLAVDEKITGWCSGPLILEMKTGAQVETGPEVALLKMANVQLAEELFGEKISSELSLRTTAKVPGAQSMMEKSLEATLGLLSGTRKFNSLATLSLADAGSIVQLMLDLELADYLKRLFKGIEADEEKIAKEVIVETSPHGAKFLETKHTLKYYQQEQWFPGLLDRRGVSAWMQDPQKMVEKARTRALDLIKSAPNRCALSEAQKKELKKILEVAKRDSSKNKN